MSQLDPNITQPALNTKDTGGVVGQPVYFDGVANIIGTSSAPTTNSDTNLNQTSSDENLSAKYKNPSVSVDASGKGYGQYQ